LPSAVFGVAGIRFALSGVFELGAMHQWGTAAGIAGLVVVALAAYGLLAFDLEAMHDRAILPTFRRGRARAALQPTPTEAAIGDVVHEPGVRQMT